MVFLFGRGVPNETKGMINLKYVYNITAKCWQDPMKALRGVDFIKYALSTIFYYVQSS